MGIVNVIFVLSEFRLLLAPVADREVKFDLLRDEFAGWMIVLDEQPLGRSIERDLAQRMGKVIRVTHEDMHYYTFNDKQGFLAKSGQEPR